MASKCYWCEEKSKPGYLPNPVGLVNEPLGCCKQCQVLACGHHAQRHHLHQEYKCFDCLAIKLVLSATSGLSDYEKQTVAAWDSQLAPLIDESPPDTYETFEQFKNDGSSYQGWFDEMENIFVDVDAWSADLVIRLIFKSLDSQHMQLLAAAGVIISKIYEKNDTVELTPLATVLNSRRFA